MVVCNITLKGLNFMVPKLYSIDDDDSQSSASIFLQFSQVCMWDLICFAAKQYEKVIYLPIIHLLGTHPNGKL